MLSLFSNTTANFNSAFGFAALYSNTTGRCNTASGAGALNSNTTGNNNLAAGYDHTSDSNNIGMGFQAGVNLTTGSNNIEIGNTGVAAESNAIRIGAGQTATCIAGIAGRPVTGTSVVASSTWQLGVTVSSERFKRDVAPRGSNSDRLTAPAGDVSFGDRSARRTAVRLDCRGGR